MMLNKKNFSAFFPKLREFFSSNEINIKVKSIGETDRSILRRITCFDENNFGSAISSNYFLQKICKHMCYSLWRTVFSSCYKDMLLTPEKAKQYGEEAVEIMSRGCTRNESTKLLAQLFRELYTQPVAERGRYDHMMAAGIFHIENTFTKKFLRG